MSSASCTCIFYHSHMSSHSVQSFTFHITKVMFCTYAILHDVPYTLHFIILCMTPKFRICTYYPVYLFICIYSKHTEIHILMLSNLITLQLLRLRFFFFVFRTSEVSIYLSISGTRRLHHY